MTPAVVVYSLNPLYAMHALATPQVKTNLNKQKQ